MLRRNGPVVKSVESVLRPEGSLWGERFVEEVGCQEEHPACKNLVSCLQRHANDFHIVQLMPLTPDHLLLH